MKEGEEKEEEATAADPQRFSVGGKRSNPLEGSETDSMASVNYMATPVKEEVKEEMVKTEILTTNEGVKPQVETSRKEVVEGSQGASQNTNPF